MDPILHLSTVNPYVASAGATPQALHAGSTLPAAAPPSALLAPPPLPVRAANAAAQHGGAAFRMAAPRLQGGAPSSSSLALGGVSSFAFQGTNSHALIAKHSSDAAALPAPGAALAAAGAARRSRSWVLPAAHPFINEGGLARLPGARAAAPTATFDCRLLAPRLALYADHTVFGRVLMPAAGMLEAVLAAGSTMLDGSAPSAATAAAATLAVSNMAISAPLVLAQPSQQAPGGLVMRCSLHPASGEFTLAHCESQQASRASAENAAGSYALAAAAAAAVALGTAAAVAVRAAALKRALLGRLLAAAWQPAPAGHATGAIVARRQLALDAYLVPPPCMDACLHLGVAAPGCGAKVPVAVGAFGLQAQPARLADGLTGATSARHAVPAGSHDTSSFAMRTGGCWVSLVRLPALLAWAFRDWLDQGGGGCRKPRGAPSCTPTACLQAAAARLPAWLTWRPRWCGPRPASLGQPPPWSRLPTSCTKLPGRRTPLRPPPRRSLRSRCTPAQLQAARLGLPCRGRRLGACAWPWAAPLTAQPAACSTWCSTHTEWRPLRCLPCCQTCCRRALPAQRRPAAPGWSWQRERWRACSAWRRQSMPQPPTACRLPTGQGQGWVPAGGQLEAQQRRRAAFSALHACAAA